MAERKWDILHHDTLEVERDVPESEVVRRARRGELALNDCLRRSGTDEWKRVSDLGKLAEVVRKAHARKTAPEDVAPAPEAPAHAAAVPAMPFQEQVATVAAAPPTEPEAADEDAVLRFPPPRTADVPVDLTPMVDVTFQLLLFFMLTATFTLQKSLEMPKPAEEKGTRTLQQILRDTITIEIDSNNNFWVDDQKVDASELARRLVQIRRSENKTSVLVQPHEDATHEAVVRALDAAQEAGIETLMLAPPKRAPRQQRFFQRRRAAFNRGAIKMPWIVTANGVAHPGMGSVSDDVVCSRQWGHATAPVRAKRGLMGA